MLFIGLSRGITALSALGELSYIKVNKDFINSMQPILTSQRHTTVQQFQYLPEHNPY